MDCDNLNVEYTAPNIWAHQLFFSSVQRKIITEACVIRGIPFLQVDYGNVYPGEN